VKYDKENIILYEVGDWVVVIEPSCGLTGKGAVRITNRMYDSDDSWKLNDTSGTYRNEWLRPATQSEILESTYIQPIMINGHEVKSISSEAIKVGCERVSKQKFLEIGEMMRWL